MISGRLPRKRKKLPKSIGHAAPLCPPANPIHTITHRSRYSATFATEDFGRVEEYLWDAYQILYAAVKYRHRPEILLREEHPHRKESSLLVEVRLFAGEGDSTEWDLPARDIAKAKAELTAGRCTDEAGENSTVVKKFRADVYGSENAYRARIPICADPADGIWKARCRCFVFTRRIELSGDTQRDVKKRRKLIRAADYYWYANHMGAGMRFSGGWRPIL